MKKKILTLGLVAALSATAAIGGTLAYFTDTADATNTFTVGNVNIELTEPGWDKVKEDKKNENVYPGQILDKDPTVTNTGANPCFIRMGVTNLDQYVEMYGTNVMINYASDDKHTPNTLGDTRWVDGGDGYFYWTEAVEPNTTIAPLFKEIIIPVELTNGAKAEDIDVIAEAVQTQGFTGDSKKVEDLKTWFETCIPATN